MARKSSASPAFRMRIVEHLTVPANEIVFAPLNPRTHPVEQTVAVTKSLQRLGWLDEVKVWRRPDGRLQLIDGEDRTRIAQGQSVPVSVLDLTEAEAEDALATYDATTYLADFDAERVRELAFRVEERDRDNATLLRLVAERDVARDLLERWREEHGEFGDGSAGDGDWQDDEQDAVGQPYGGDDDEQDDSGEIGFDNSDARSAALVAKFGAPPFSVLDTRQGYWQERRRAWLALGIESEIGRDVRGANIRFGAGAAMRRTLSTDDKDFQAGEGHEAPALSIFDPVLSELVYRWFSPPGGLVLDPFAGGSVRGIVAAHTHRRYLGVELRREQVEANRDQWARIGGPEQQAAKPRSLAQWMSRLYQLAADEGHLQGDLGVWPQELREYLELLCIAHGVSETEPCRFRVAPRLITSEQGNGKPREPKTCVVLFSGGKDCIAAARLAEKAGYTVHCVHVRSVNRSFPMEAERAEHFAAAMGWRFQYLAPRDLPDVDRVSVAKNQYLWAVVLDVLPFVPGAVAFGNFRYDDGDTTNYFNDMECAFASFQPAVDAAYGAGTIHRMRSLEDEVESFRECLPLPDAARQWINSCAMPARYKVQHHARNVGYGIPHLSEYDCGSCEKCHLRAVILATHFGVVYPEAYLAKARKHLGEAFSGALHCNSHDRLRTYPGGSYEHLMNSILGGTVKRSWRAEGYPGVEPVVSAVGGSQQPASPVPLSPVVATNTLVSDPKGLTPVCEVAPRIWLKRDEVFTYTDGAVGSKARIVAELAEGAAGLVTAGGTESAQIGVVARIARAMGIPCRLHVPATKEPSAVILAAEALGAEIIGHMPGHSSVIRRRAIDDAAARAADGWRLIPMLLEDTAAITPAMKAQVANIPTECQRLVVAVGGGMTLAAILHGLREAARADLPVLGVYVGSDPTKRLDAYAPAGWQEQVTLVAYGTPYHQPAEQTVWWNGDVPLDAFYEAKAAEFVQPGDCLWVIGYEPARQPKRAVYPGTAETVTEAGEDADATWICGDSRELRALVPTDAPDADLIFTCPPYYNLEIYSDDVRDLSNAPTYEAFRDGYRAVIAQSVARLRDDRFAAIVVGDIRDDEGFVRPFVCDTIRAFEDAGARLYNDSVVILPAGTLPVRAGRTFTSGRKLGRMHQRLLVFCKGDPKRATAACGPVDDAVTLPSALGETEDNAWQDDDEDDEGI